MLYRASVLFNLWQNDSAKKTRVPISVTNVENLVEKKVNVNFVSYIIEVLFDMLRTWIVMW